MQWKMARHVINFVLSLQAINIGSNTLCTAMRYFLSRFPARPSASAVPYRCKEPQSVDSQCLAYRATGVGYLQLTIGNIGKCHLHMIDLARAGAT